MKLGALACIASLVTLTFISPHHRATSLLSTRRSETNLGSLLRSAEKQVDVLQAEAPRGLVARAFPKEEAELSDLYSRTEKGLQSIEKYSEANALISKPQAHKQARTGSLAQLPRGRSKLSDFVGKASQTIAALEAQLPPAERRAFPRETAELQKTLNAELNSLAKIKGSVDRRARGMRIAHGQMKAALNEQTAQGKLEENFQKDITENRKLSGTADVDSVLDTLNGISPSKKAGVQSLSAVKPDNKKAAPGKKAAPAAGSKQQRRPARPTVPTSPVERWGAVYDPTLKWRQGSGSELEGPAQRYFKEYSKEATDALNVHDPAKDIKGKGDWWTAGSAKDSWWQHDHTGRGY
ncbi:hypothetical protein GUITHDRAFT_150367 [Guillardia theta CCMP2712]|uniref:Uncharacterized protein n=1 Tax=Guillardia theta (strain CCMP2712) TaxID=905079 RepID=L1JYM3_GUITC|nr:hypothetical protein GUITHDRAFT_150367 [Guillardia theta CCMP2712]EKX53290.1 hypothetical protein GUITHDRAFT_150367 [Guillardia theta CCMP2712]|eukprot:XP_005840270.1 hypothetical protein GUITHDRAFT_150367 [Guillardia theta CCMP2712]